MRYVFHLSFFFLFFQDLIANNDVINRSPVTSSSSAGCPSGSSSSSGSTPKRSASSRRGRRRRSSSRSRTTARRTTSTSLCAAAVGPSPPVCSCTWLVAGPRELFSASFGLVCRDGYPSFLLTPWNFFFCSTITLGLGGLLVGEELDTTLGRKRGRMMTG